MVLYEIFQFILFTLLRLEIPEGANLAQTKDGKPSRLRIFMEYLLATTLHGFQYLVLIR